MVRAYAAGPRFSVDAGDHRVEIGLGSRSGRSDGSRLVSPAYCSGVAGMATSVGSRSSLPPQAASVSAPASSPGRWRSSLTCWRSRWTGRPPRCSSRSATHKGSPLEDEQAGVPSSDRGQGRGRRSVRSRSSDDEVDYGHRSRNCRAAASQPVPGRRPSPRWPPNLLCADGEVGDGRGRPAALCLGSDGIVVGTRFGQPRKRRASQPAARGRLRSGDGRCDRARSILTGSTRAGAGHRAHAQECAADRWHGKGDDLPRPDEPVDARHRATARDDARNVSPIVGEAIGLIHGIAPAGDPANDGQRSGSDPRDAPRGSWPNTLGRAGAFQRRVALRSTTPGSSTKMPR